MSESVDKSLIMLLLIMGAIWLVINEFYGKKKIIVPFARKIVDLMDKGVSYE